MKRLVCVLAFAASIAAAPSVIDYSGHWKLDPATSRNLPKEYAVVVSDKLAVEPAENVLTVIADRVTKSGEAIHDVLPFDLTGKDTASASGLLLHAQRDGAGHLETTIRRKAIVMHESWNLSPDGRVLTIHRKDETPDGVLEFDLVYVRD